MILKAQMQTGGQDSDYFASNASDRYGLAK